MAPVERAVRINEIGGRGDVVDGQAQRLEVEGLPHFDTNAVVETAFDPLRRGRAEAAVTIEDEGALRRRHGQRRPVLGLRPWFAFLRRALHFFLDFRFDIQARLAADRPQTIQLHHVDADCRGEADRMRSQSGP